MWVAPGDEARAVARRGDQLADEAHGDGGDAAFGVGLDDVGLVDANEALVDDVAALVARGQFGGEFVIDFARQQILECLAVALGKRRDDHLIGLACALDEGGRIEGRVILVDIEKALRNGLVASRKALDALLGIGQRHLADGCRRRIAARHGHDVRVWGCGRAPPLRRAIFTPGLGADVLAKYAAQLQDREHCDN